MLACHGGGYLRFRQLTPLNTQSSEHTYNGAYGRWIERSGERATGADGRTGRAGWMVGCMSTRTHFATTKFLNCLLENPEHPPKQRRKKAHSHSNAHTRSRTPTLTYTLSLPVSPCLSLSLSLSRSLALHSHILHYQ